MANTYTQIHIHFIFAVKFRNGIIQTQWKDNLYKYISGIVHNNNHKLLAINGTSDHIHILIGIRPSQSISDLMKDVKQGSSLWINENKLCPGKFAWQEGFGAFSYGTSQVQAIASYIENQQQHHLKRTFIDEYVAFLRAFNIDYDERYIYKPID